MISNIYYFLIKIYYSVNEKKLTYKNSLSNCGPFHNVLSLAISFAFFQAWFKLLLHYLSFICKMGVKVTTNLP